MKIAVGLGSPVMCNLATVVLDYLKKEGHAITLCGTLTGKPTDYIEASLDLGEKISSGQCEMGVLFCNTGTGVSIITNKLYGVRAALCPDAFTAKIARQANNANVLVLGIRMTGEKLALEILQEWLKSDPSDASDAWKEFHARTAAIDEKHRRNY